MIEALRERGLRLNEIEMAAALVALIELGKAEVLNSPRMVRRNARRVARCVAA